MEDPGNHCKTKSMTKKLLTGWTTSRIIFTLLGIAIILQTAMDRQVFGVILGAYILLMGLFGFGCAAVNCNIRESKK
jgi:membrane-bound ClpP family serine protease